MNILDEINLLLREKGLTISTAESCTAGFISQHLTKKPGSSEFFKGSIVAYSNEIKVKLLEVDKKTIDKYTEVSFNVAKQMAENAKRLMNTDLSISTTGYADINGSGTDDNPPGTIYIAFSSPDETEIKRLYFTGSRQENVYAASIEALTMLREYLRNLQA